MHLVFGAKYFDWLHDFLLKRNQRVLVHGEQSEWQCIVSGVPQGSVLDPMLFLIFINYLVFVGDTMMYMYTND